ncbi:hypothetical protein LTR36_002044 [Oleoguttula mirabilis]|uniref:Large ribosomal subunit protein mL38 n=1 Tax=Oleoguttula mirabilis TaxID=1507867 RepID=A0AAV9JM20_9PEZI|nr:hypothetical protein LTR36_002044 [Oleoguttula mirabilis]
MALDRSAGRLARCIRCTRHERTLPIRTFTTTAPSRLETQETQASSEPPPPPAGATTDAPKPRLRDPNTVSTRAAEQQLIQHQRITPVGSRRRRAAIASTSNIPFSELPYQCFQEARAVLQADRKQKLEHIRVQRERIERFKAKDVAPQDEAHKEKKVADMRRRLEEQKILADINDPVVKRKFEDGEGDLNKPIYRLLADRQWRSYRRTLLLQRITQMNVVPDVLPAIDPVVSTALSFAGKRVQHGDFVDSRMSELAPSLQIQPYDKGKRLYTVVVVNPDVPNVQKDAFDYRCHFLASNIEISPTDTRVRLGLLGEEGQVILPWLPAYGQKGAPYQRMSMFVLEQAKSEGGGEFQTIDVAAVKAGGKYTQRHGFNLRSFVDKHLLKPVGVDLFRTKWDEGTAGVMQRAGIVGWDVEFKRKRVEPLPYKRMDSVRYR